MPPYQGTMAILVETRLRHDVRPTKRAESVRAMMIHGPSATIAKTMPPRGCGSPDKPRATAAPETLPRCCYLHWALGASPHPGAAGQQSNEPRAENSRPTHRYSPQYRPAEHIRSAQQRIPPGHTPTRHLGSACPLSRRNLTCLPQCAPFPSPGKIQDQDDSSRNPQNCCNGCITH